MTSRIPGQIVVARRADGTTFRAPVYDEHEVRAAAGLTLAAATIAFCYAYFEHRFLPIKVVSTFFLVEFLIRVTAGFQYSPTGLVSRVLVLRREPQWVSAKPKRFAWTLGLLMSASMTVITNLDVHGLLPRTVCLICIVLMWFEAALGVCLGCEIHGLMVRLGWTARDPAFEVCAGGACDLPRRPVTTPVPSSSEVVLHADHHPAHAAV
jgi:hypothetical protein